MFILDIARRWDPFQHCRSATCNHSPRVLVALSVFVALVVQGLVGAAPARAEDKLLLQEGGLSAHAMGRKKDGVWCGKNALVRLVAPDTSIFTGDQKQLEAVAEQIRSELKSACPKSQAIRIEGYVGERRVYKGLLAANRPLKQRFLAKDLKAPTTATMEASPSADGNQAISASPFSSARSVGEQCQVLVEWTKRFWAEYPDENQSGVRRGAEKRRETELRSMNLFSDSDFVPRFGIEFDQSAVALRRAIAEAFVVCKKQHKEELPRAQRAVRGSHCMVQILLSEEAVSAKHGTCHFTGASQIVGERRKVRAWRDSQLTSIAKTPKTPEGLSALQDLAASGPQRVAALWPSEQKTFIDKVAARKSIVALGMAKDQIAGLPNHGDSLHRLTSIVDATKPHVVEADQGQFAALNEFAEQRRQAIRVVLVEAEIEALASYPETVAGLEKIIERRERIVEIVGTAPPLPMLDTLQEASASRGNAIAGAYLSQFQEELSRIPATLEGTKDALSAFNRISGVLGQTTPGNVARYEQAAKTRADAIAQAALPAFEKRLAQLPIDFASVNEARELLRGASDTLATTAPARRPGYEQVANKRVDEIYEALIEQGVTKFSTKEGGWREAIGLLGLAQHDLGKFTATPAKTEADRIEKAAKDRAAELLRKNRPSYQREIASVPESWGGLEKLANIDRDLAAVEQDLPAISEYRQDLFGRRAEIVAELSEQALEQVDHTGTGFEDVIKVIEIAAHHQQRFTSIGEEGVVKDIDKAATARATELVKKSLPQFEKEISRRDNTRDEAAKLTNTADEFDRWAQQWPDFKAYADVARRRSQEMLAAVCDAAVARGGVRGDLHSMKILGPDQGVTVQEFICRLDEHGHQVSELASPGTLNVSGGYTLKILQSNGDFVHARLRQAEALPGQELLVGFALGDVNRQPDISVNEWQKHVGRLLVGAAPVTIGASGRMTSQELAERLQRSVAFVLWQEPGSIRMGTGFFVSRSLLVTNHHVVDGADPNAILVTSAALGSLRKGKIIGSSKGHEFGNRDYAIIAFDKPLPVDPLTVASQVKPLAQVVTAGYPGFLTKDDPRRARLFSGDLSVAPEMVFSAGEVSVIQKSQSGVPLVVHSAEISQGNSGGPLVDLCGRVVGVNTFFASDQNSRRVAFKSLGGNDLLGFLNERGINVQGSDKAC